MADRTLAINGALEETSIMIDEFSSDDFATLVEEIAYSGFDPVEILVQVRKSASYSAADMSWLIMLGMERGNNINKMVNKMSDAGKAKVSTMKARYSIMSKATRRDTVTLSRICLVHPYQSSVYAATYQKNFIVSPAEVEAVIPGYPKAMMSPAFGGLLVKETPMLARVFSVYQMLVSEKLSGGKKRRGKALLDESEKFVLAAMNSSFPPRDNRVKWLNELKLGDKLKFVALGLKAYDSFKGMTVSGEDTFFDLPRD